MTTAKKQTRRKASEQVDTSKPLEQAQKQKKPEKIKVRFIQPAVYQSKKFQEGDETELVSEHHYNPAFMQKIGG